MSSAIEDLQEYLAERKNIFNKSYKGPASDKKWSDFKQIQTIGAGGFGTVVLVQNIDDKKYYAIKVIEREKAVKAKTQTKNEKNILRGLDFPFVIKMEYYFKDNTYLFFVLQFINGGDLFTFLRSRNCFSESHSMFYGAQVVLALEYLHYINIIYRDLKPENILIDSLGYIRITDFGLAKYVKRRTYTICGTPDYIAPEILFGGGYTDAVDWWSFGVLLYEMVSGKPPFLDVDELATFDRVIEGNYTMDQKFSRALQDLVNKLLVIKTSQRLGCLKKGSDDIKSHEWFKDVSWLDILNKRVKAPIRPQARGPGDARCFRKYGKFELKTNSTELFARELKDF